MDERNNTTVADNLIDFIRGRERLGELKYGERLRAFNGRNAVRDALEEAVDFAMYLMQIEIEKGFKGFDLIDYICRQKEWSGRTFGGGRRTLGITNHIRKELEEIEKDPDDVEEWIDVIILAIDGAWRAGHSSYKIVQTLKAKQVKNFGRRWPEPGPEDEPMEHVRDGQ